MDQLPRNDLHGMSSAGGRTSRKRVLVVNREITLLMSGASPQGYAAQQNRRNG